MIGDLNMSTTKSMEKLNTKMTFFINYDGENVSYIDSENHSICCCDIWMASLPSNNGSIQNGHRPVLIISNNKNNKYVSQNFESVNILPYFALSKIGNCVLIAS